MSLNCQPHAALPSAAVVAAGYTIQRPCVEPFASSILEIPTPECVNGTCPMTFKLSEPAKIGAEATVVPLAGPKSEPHQLKRRSNILVVGAELLVVAETVIPLEFEARLLLLTKI